MDLEQFFFIDCEIILINEMNFDIENGVEYFVKCFYIQKYSVTQ